jgi:signal transduction histidine kinase
MEKTNAELISELNELKQKYSDLESKYNFEIAEYKKKEEELQMKLMFLEGVANSTIDGFLVVNPYGQKILQNQRTIELWKIPQDVVDDPSGIRQVNHVMNMTVNPQQFVAEIDYLREHPDDKSRDELELVDGTVLDRYSSPVIGSDGENYGRIWTFHDITERKNLEKQLIQLNTDKDHFISILAHDLRSPFNNLLGFSELLKRNLNKYPLDKIEKMVDSIYITAVRTHELLEDTLVWASNQSKKVNFNPTLTNISNLVMEILEIVDVSAKSKNISITSAIDTGLNIYVDAYMLKAILRNLVSNAIKFTNEGGSIKISAEHSDKGTTFQVIDNGIGMAPELQKKLFSFASFQSTRGTANEMGTGLGLLLCKEFIDKHNGKIWINSEVNRGTTVNFNFPEITSE